MEEILREILAADKTILSRRDDLLAAIEKKVPNNLRRDYAPIKRAINLNVSEIFFVGESDKDATKTKVADILKSSGMQEARINFVIETFTKALDWDKIPEVEESFDDEEEIPEVEENFDDEEILQPEIKPATKTQQILPPPQVQPPPLQKISPPQVQPPPTQTSTGGNGKKFLIGGICLLALMFFVSSGGNNSSDDNSSAPPIQHTQQVQEESPPPQITQTAPPEDKSYLNAKTELSLNGIDLGVPVKQLTDKWGEPKKIEKREDGNLRYLYDNMKIGIVGGIVHSFYTEDPKFKTFCGLHVGSTYSEVIEKYGTDSYDMEKDGLILHEYPFTSLNGKQGLLRFAVKKSTNIVHYISVRIIEEPAAVKNSARLENVRYNAEKGTLRIVLDVTKATNFKKSTMENPSRLVVDLPDTTVADNFQSYARELNSDVAQRIRIAQFNDSTARVVVETRAKTKVFKLDDGPSGNRIVIDVFR